MDSKCQDARRKRRKAERDHRRKGNQESRTAYSSAHKHAEAVINVTKNEYYKSRLEQSRDNKKDTYRIVNHLMDRHLSKSIQPNHKSEDVITEELKDFFHEKVDSIYSNFVPESDQDDDIPSLKGNPIRFSGRTLNSFKTIDSKDLREIIRDLNKKECEGDPIPVKLLMECLDELEPIILFIVNTSLTTGTFPSILKNALVRPAIKDENGDPNSYKNYRPISNLPFLSKIIEKSVQRQLDIHLKMHDLHSEFQSGYRMDHSCETATLAIYNDLLCLSDSQSKVVLLLLDLSAAFDTVNHPLLLKKLEENFGLTGNVLMWFKSYLSNRSFTVTIGKSRSKKCYLRIGVPQGSILGPILFILYTKELVEIAKEHGFNIHLYADDTQLYIEFNPISQDLTRVEERIIRCLREITSWMTRNKLKLNPNKTEALIAQVRSKFSHNTVQSTDVLRPKIEGETIDPLPVVKSLGVKFDEFLTLEDHVNSVLQCCYSNLRNLGVIGGKLSFDLKKQLIHCLIFSKLDYCNGLFYDLPDYLIKRLQKVQHSCTRFLFSGAKLQRGDSVTPFLKEAHFLPVKQRIVFKIALTVFKCINNIAPTYLQKMIKVKDQPTKNLRTESDYFLLQHPPPSNLRRTERSFTHCAPVVWNSLPYSLRTMNDVTLFKKRLKTHLFCETFDSLC